MRPKSRPPRSTPSLRSRPTSRRPRPTTSRAKTARRPISVAITGGIGVGKTTALEAFARHGAATVSSDEIVHHLLRTDEDVRRALVERLGDRILDADGEIDRTRVGELVFRDPELLAWLEALLHPRVAAAYLEWREQLAELPDAPRVSVTEVPLLYEVGGDERFDVVVALTASPRLRARRGRPVPDERAGRQLPDEEKLRRADFAYVNNGSLEDLDAFVAGVMSRLQQADIKET
jgi:dephospho-CoA kinase